MSYLWVYLVVDLWFFLISLLITKVSFRRQVMTTSKKIRFLFQTSIFLAFVELLSGQEVPDVFGPILKPDLDVKGELVVVLPPEEIQSYINKVKQASAKDPEWFKEFSAKSKPGIPLPYDEKLGLSPKEYQEYRELWDKREFKAVAPVSLRLTKVGDETVGFRWKLRGSGEAARLSLLSYLPKEDVVVSTNGKMARLEDIDAPAESILGAWKGREWRFEEETGLSKVKENFAIGETVDGKYGLVVYRLQDVSSAGSLLFDKRMVIRFPNPDAK